MTLYDKIKQGFAKIKTGLKWTSLIAVLLALNDSAYIVDQKNHAVITQFGKPVKVIVNPVFREKEVLERLKKEYAERGIAYSERIGLNVRIPFIQKVNRIDRRLISWDGYPEQVTTKDKRYIWEDVTARWYIEDPLKYFEKVETIENGQARLDDILDSYTRKIITNHDLIECVRNTNRKMFVEESGSMDESVQQDSIKFGREKIMNEITDGARGPCGEYGIGVKDVKIKRLNYVESVKIEVEKRMISERKRIAELYRSEGRGESQRIEGQKELDVSKIKSGAYKTAEKIKGQGDKEATRIYAEAYQKDPDFYQFWRTLDLLPSGLETSNAHLVIGTDNELFKYLKNPNPKK